jgi:hypothetical protein
MRHLPVIILAVVASCIIALCLWAQDDGMTECQKHHSYDVCFTQLYR